MLGKNKLAPESFLEQLKNFALNLLWAFVWLGKWIWRGLRHIVNR